MLGLRSIEVISPVGETHVAFEQMTGDEALGRPFEFTVDLLSSRGDLKIEDAVGKRMTIVLAMGMHPPRHFNGVVARFAQVAWTGDQFRYRATLRPWLWLLTRTSDSRIFQHKTVPEILAALFDAHGFSGEVDDSLLDHGSYKPHEYLVQYDESDFNFVSRLMEQAGITYHFKHAADRHMLVLSDGPLTEKVPGRDSVPYVPGDDVGADGLGQEHVNSWSVGLTVTSGALAAKEFDFKNPRAPLLSVLQAPKPGGDAKMEVFEYPGNYIDDELRQNYVARRLDEQQLNHEISHAAGNARGIQAGVCFKLTDYPWDTQNKEYLVTGASYTLALNELSSGEGASQPDFLVSFYAIDSKRTYRTPAMTPKTRVAGPQTAIVAGEKQQEIWTDKYGRVKVQFHWDRAGKNDETSSCWVRVAQTWAGAAWGAIHIPRVGQEVIVDFLEGDPDRPIITGRVYNNDNMPPYELPANQTQSGIKSRSTPKGGPGNFNEIRFEDKKGSELFYIQAEKDLHALVENDEARAVGHDRTTEIENDETITVGKNRTEKVGEDESITIGGNRTESVAKNESVTIGGGRTLTIAVTDAISVGVARALSVGGNDDTTVGAKQSVSVGGSQSVSAGTDQSVTVGKDQSTTVGENRKLDIAKDDTVSVGGKRTVNIGKNDILEIGAKLSINVKDEISITTGDATISLKKNGDVTIKGKNITFEGSGKVNVKASGDVIIKGSKISQN